MDIEYLTRKNTEYSRSNMPDIYVNANSEGTEDYFNI